MKTAVTAVVTALLPVLLAAGGCAGPQRKVPVSELKQNPSLGDNESIQFVISDLQDVFAHYGALEDNTIEVTAPVTYYGRRQYWTWYLLLEEGGGALRCYTHHYRLRADRFAELLLERAMREGDEITVVGTLQSDGIDTEMILYDGQVVRTDLMPEPYYITPWPYYY